MYNGNELDKHSSNLKKNKSMKTKPALKQKTGYSKRKLKKFQSIIEKKLKKAKENLEFLRNANTPGGQNGTNDTAPVFKHGFDGGNQSTLKEENDNFISFQKKEIQLLKNALKRIETGNYGICSVTRKPIPESRLIVMPHATTSIEGEIKKEEQQKFN